MIILKKILVISWFFPPIISSEGMVTYKLLNKSSLEYDVFTQKQNTDWSYGHDNLPINTNINVIQANVKDLKEFKKSAIEYYNENIDKYDMIMTRSMPEESHEIGIEIKKINPKIFWIASFGDPIGKNPYVVKALDTINPYAITGVRSILSAKRLIKSYLFKKGKRYNYNVLIKEKSKLESQIVKSADKLILNNEYQREYMAKCSNTYKLFMDKSTIIPHSYDKSLYKEQEKNVNKIIFRFIGHLDDIRTPKYLFQALSILQKNDSKIAEKVQFEFYGDMGDNDKLFVINNDLIDLVKIKKPVGYLESLSLMQSADWLIHIDANISEVLENNIFFAAKLADYIGTGNNIIGITMPIGASADILREHNQLCLSNCTSDIVNYLYLIIYKKFKLPENNVKEKLDAQIVAKQFDKWIEAIKDENRSNV